jgi:hypothetical protein
VDLPRSLTHLYPHIFLQFSSFQLIISLRQGGFRVGPNFFWSGRKVLGRVGNTGHGVRLILLCKICELFIIVIALTSHICVSIWTLKKTFFSSKRASLPPSIFSAKKAAADPISDFYDEDRDEKDVQLSLEIQNCKKRVKPHRKKQIDIFASFNR